MGKRFVTKGMCSHPPRGQSTRPIGPATIDGRECTIHVDEDGDRYAEFICAPGDKPADYDVAVHGRGYTSFILYLLVGLFVCGIGAVLVGLVQAAP